MRLILSRKGFDSSAGGRPSPIFPDGTLLSLPIPDRDGGTAYGELACRDGSMGSLVEALTKGKVPAHYQAHLDPDLDKGTLHRDRGWRPSFGQAGAAQTRLAKDGVGPGDVFLFFGWFREVEEKSGGYRYVPGSPNLHVIFGWLRVGKVLAIPTDPVPAWAERHPHVLHPNRKNNTLYVSSETLELDGVPSGVPGAGTFASYDDSRRLTAHGEGNKRSLWELPSWFLPRDDRPALGYHTDEERWHLENNRLLLQTVARGQEFVLHMDSYPEAESWLCDLLSEVS